MRLLIAVKTCHRLDYYIDDLTVDWLTSTGQRYLDVTMRRAAQRETWLSQLPEGVDYKFFYGSEFRRLDVKPNQRPGTSGPAPVLPTPSKDEVYLPCGDGYLFNSAKAKEICRYAVDLGYDYILLVDDDTYVNVPNLLSVDFYNYHYSGSPSGAFHPGSCLFLSRAAMESIRDSRITNFADDLWIGEVMEAAGIRRHDIKTIYHGFGQDYKIDPRRVKNIDFAALHSCTPKVMAELWTRQTMSLSEQRKDTVGKLSDPTPSASLSPASVDARSSSPATSPTQPEQPSNNSGSKSLTTPATGITPLSKDSASFATGWKQSDEIYASPFTATSETS